jgi:hypothetical protein
VPLAPQILKFSTWFDSTSGTSSLWQPNRANCSPRILCASDLSISHFPNRSLILNFQCCNLLEKKCQPHFKAMMMSQTTGRITQNNHMAHRRRAPAQPAAASVSCIQGGIGRPARHTETTHFCRPIDPIGVTSGVKPCFRREVPAGADFCSASTETFNCRAPPSSRSEYVPRRETFKKNGQIGKHVQSAR